MLCRHTLRACLDGRRVFYPPYLFTGTGGQSAVRPEIVSGPKDLAYRGAFDVKIAGSANQIGSVVLLRSDHNTHSLTAGDRYVKLAFHVKGNPNDGEVRVIAPKLPSQAVPGISMLFVVR